MGVYLYQQNKIDMTNLTTTTLEIIKMINPSEVLVSSENYLQCIVNGVFTEYQKDYIEKKWFQFKTIGSSNSPKELFVKFI